MPDVDDAQLATVLVEEAGALAESMLRRGLEVETKTHVSDIVTAADKAAEAHVVETLRRERPEDSIVGEEGADHVGTSGRTWVIDPVDGTYNFHRGLDWWCSALALVDGDDLVLGAVHHPSTATTYVGGPGLASTVATGCRWPGWRTARCASRAPRRTSIRRSTRARSALPSSVRSRASRRCG